MTYKPYNVELLDSSSSSGWVSDKMYEVLNYVSQFSIIRPYDLVIAGYCKDSKTAYVYIQRLVRRGVLQRVGRGIYRVVHEVVQKLLKLPIRRLRVRKSKQSVSNSVVRFSKGTRCLGGLVGGCVGVGGVVGGFGYVGVFFDNVRWVGFGGGLCQLGRGGLLGFGGLPGGVRYFEVAHAVSGVVLDGVVVVYSNVEDFGRFGKPSVRVEWRPPKGFVRRNGVAGTVHYARHEFVKAFKSLAVVLKEVLSPKELGRLFNWLSWRWGINTY
jgi:hypothetical protein